VCLTMAAVGGVVAPQAGVKPYLEPWRVINWSDGQLNRLYRDFGIYYSRKRRFNSAIDSFNAAMALDQNDIHTLRRRSHVKRLQGIAPQALIDAQEAQGILQRDNPLAFDPTVNLEICDGFYESNRLEDAKRNLHDNLRIISTSQAKPFQNRLFVVNANIQDALSDETGAAVHRLIGKMVMNESKQPRRTANECDVLSIQEKESEFLSPLEHSRRARELNIYNQNYLDKSWRDVAFLKKILSKPNLFLDQFVESKSVLKELANLEYKTVRIFTKMLHTRCPGYSLNMSKFPNQELKAKHNQENLFRLQYQTRRNMFQILRTIRTLIQNKALRKLSSYVEEVMGNYVTIKTNRIMPWKFEFISEVYNYLGLARINEYKIPSDLKVLAGRNRMLTLFKIPQKLMESQSQISLTGLNVSRIAMVDLKAEHFKKQIARYEYRMLFAKYPIERSYLLHELAQAHLNNNSFDTCCLLAQKSMEEAISGNHYIWAVLSALVACKVYAILGKVEKQREMLIIAFRLGKKLRNIDLCLFIDICYKVNSEEIEMKKSMHASDFGVRKRLRRSASSIDHTSSDTSLFR
ncbi:hypothetical protein KR222_000685, partial [Zaprionus bogoriensis]